MSPAEASSSIASAPVPVEESKRDASTAPFCSILRSWSTAAELFVITNVGADKPTAGYASISIPPAVAIEVPALIAIASAPVPAELRARDALNVPACVIVKSCSFTVAVFVIVNEGFDP